jgi:hypothetical protein
MVRSPTHDFAEVQNFHRRKIAQCALPAVKQFRPGPAFLENSTLPERRAQFYEK